MKLLNNYSGVYPEAGCDEAGRGCLAGPVFAAAVILPEDFSHDFLNDSKQLSEKRRNELRLIIEQEALDFAVAKMNPSDIDTYNILWASVRTMHLALDGLSIHPQHIIVDGNKFMPYRDTHHDCIIKGDGKYSSIAAASILAKTYRDEYMDRIAEEYPQYQWHKNKGYPTAEHRKAIMKYGDTPYHRKSFRLLPDKEQLSLFGKNSE
ncbi:MAG: ribonuclease HII [Chitinophagales bacterium]|nr:ribonuclease HII [Chitinophagales bacterium]